MQLRAYYEWYYIYIDPMNLYCTNIKASILLRLDLVIRTHCHFQIACKSYLSHGRPIPNFQPRYSREKQFKLKNIKRIKRKGKNMRIKKQKLEDKYPHIYISPLKEEDRTFYSVAGSLNTIPPSLLFQRSFRRIPDVGRKQCTGLFIYLIVVLCILQSPCTSNLFFFFSQSNVASRGSDMMLHFFYVKLQGYPNMTKGSVWAPCAKKIYFIVSFLLYFYIAINFFSWQCLAIAITHDMRTQVSYMYYLMLLYSPCYMMSSYSTMQLAPLLSRRDRQTRIFFELFSH